MSCGTCQFHSVQNEPAATANACGPKRGDFWAVFCLVLIRRWQRLQFLVCRTKLSDDGTRTSEYENLSVPQILSKIMEVRCSQLCSVPSEAEQRLPRSWMARLPRDSRYWKFLQRYPEVDHLWVATETLLGWSVVR